MNVNEHLFERRERLSELRNSGLSWGLVKSAATKALNKKNKAKDMIKKIATKQPSKAKTKALDKLSKLAHKKELQVDKFHGKLLGFR